MNPALSPLLMLPFLLVACVQPTTAELEAKLCGDLEAFGASLTELSQINAQSSVNQLRQARENVAQSFQAVKDSAKAVEASRLDDLTAAYDNFDKTASNPWPWEVDPGRGPRLRAQPSTGMVPPWGSH
ncbi:MAG TPA: hypothetical protein IGR64_08800 [Leptolyngbyaceae cyanobacterium M65_K2018_010]|nr:hypothetical protein [Leptolyngbyaceae cyanobacterium M65_K2018_010]